MKDNQLLMLSINGVHNFLKSLMKIDIYDRCTIEWFSRNILKEASLEELYKMKETVARDENNSSRSNASFWSSFSLVIALFIGTIGILLTINTTLKVEHSFLIILLLYILLAILVFISIAICLERFINKRRNRLSDLIRILIYLKENE
ncbi:hypothetical protein J2B92_12335 [Lysinibacillus sphaericus]|uniref:hypothetical protein n=1 Tax=Lysinibacillus sphaericus TaxID=1421 RepID=UPI001A9F4660|nr:hypothetical protein [Lysinibacillus sphaericus]QTB11733.1 hypothetical protein J2B92_12335 [Lysinibacillus sphaericus]